MATTNRSVTNNPGNRGSEPGGSGTGGEGNAPTKGSPAKAENDAEKQRADQGDQAGKVADVGAADGLADRQTGG